MRRFTSYGPVDPRFNYAVERRALVEQCVAQLVGEGEEAGHFFTLWAPRQTGKTWLMRRAIEEIRAAHGERFVVGSLLMQGVMGQDDPEEVFLRAVPRLFRDGFGVDCGPIASWDDWMGLFGRKGGVFDRPVILLIDEFDSLPPVIIDRLVTRFRAMYLERHAYAVHGLALVGVRAVLGLDSPRGSPFNVQRSVHVPNLTRDEVVELFAQYQAESAQAVEDRVVAAVFETTRGQPGLVGWLGELLTEKYNPVPSAPITLAGWEEAYRAAREIEPNNTVLNLVKKARGPYLSHVVGLFGNPDVPFSFDTEWCNFLYLNGIIDSEDAVDGAGRRVRVCRFASPFVQLRLYNALARDLYDDRFAVLPLDPLDALDDVFSTPELDLAALLGRYRGYLRRVAAKGQSPWKDQPRRTDTHLTEAVGHFHLYAWLQDALRGLCAVLPEFPTGNGKVDLLLRGKGREGVIEVKSFRARHELPRAREQVARYARGRGLGAAAIALFVPTEDEAVLAALSGEEVVGGVRVIVVAIGWG